MKELARPSMALQEAFIKMAHDYREHGEQRYYCDLVKDGFDFMEYVTSLTRKSQNMGNYLEEGLVPFTTYWFIDEKRDTIFGVSRLRHCLNSVSIKEGGHIGYDVPPSHRGAGIATELLRQTIIKAKAYKLPRLLLTCDVDNFASIRVIEKNGGVLEDTITSDYTRKLVNRYWIEC